MSVRKLGTWVPEDYDREAEPVLTEFRYFLDSTDEDDSCDAVFNVYPSTSGDGALIGWYLDAVGLVTWHRADSIEEATEWVYSELTPWTTSDYGVSRANGAGS
jgi:hypothetical protein